MNYSEKTKPGMGDPYWYEWSVGQQYIIDISYCFIGPVTTPFAQ